ncbi:MAG: UPF0149 family protein [Desulfocapsaceae bacterium]|nr:UPF0149 family protein [Desulfocapsaceae bacterium]
MSTLITQKDEKNLRKLLAIAISPEKTFSYDELRGYLYGIAITPDVIDPSEWVPVVFGDDKPEYESDEQVRELMGTLFTVLNRHVAAFQDDNLFMPFDMKTIREKDVIGILEWTSGFEEALSLRPECWEEHRDLDEEEQDRLMNSLVVIEGIVYPEDAVDMFTHLPPEELEDMGVDISGNSANRVIQVQLFMLQALEQSIETIQSHGARQEKKRKEAARSSATPFDVPTSIIEKNKKCPCYSGKLFRDCCGKKEQSGGETSRKGKLIKVDFSKRSRSSEEKIFKLSADERTGHSYQLEISLASTEPTIWRRLEVPGAVSLADLHLIIQVTMGWENQHLHQFRAGKKIYGPQVADDYSGTPVLDESRFCLSDLEREFLQGVIYTYDFDDNWEHVILIEKVLPPSESRKYPYVIGGERACPPEDIGGAFEFSSLLEYLDGSREKDFVDRFAQLPPFDPEHYDKDIANQLLKVRYDDQ